MSLINNGINVMEDILSHLNSPEYCDVTIVATDGEVQANKVILGMRSQYFHSMFSKNNNFVEAQNNSAKMPYSKAILEKLILYLYSGKLDCEDMALRPLMDLLDLLNLLTLSMELSIVEGFVTDNIKKGTFPISDCLKYLDDCSKLGLITVRETLLSYLGDNFAKFSQAEEVGHLSELMIIRLLEEKNGDSSQTILRLRTFVTWLAVNSIDTNAKEKVLKTLRLEDFTFKDLSSDVRKSGLYSIDKIMERMENFYNVMEKEVDILIREKLKQKDEMREDLITVKNSGNISEYEWQSVPLRIKLKYNV